MTIIAFSQEVSITSSQKSLQEVKKLLLSYSLPPIPVAPKQGDGKIFNGKNPSYLDAQGNIKTVKHKDFHNKLPSERTVSEWFRNPSNGIGTLGGFNNVCLLDFDTKHFDSQESFDNCIDNWISQYPSLQETWIERTRSGGIRIILRLKTDSDFTNFTIKGSNILHIGEALGRGRFAVLAPTEGYTVINYPESDLVEVESLESIGLIPSKTKPQEILNNGISDLIQAEQPENTLSFYKLASQSVKAILDGQSSSDRSADLTKVAYEVFGWYNWLSQGQYIEYLQEDPTNTTTHSGLSLGLDSDKIQRIISTVDTSNCYPSVYRVGGNEACTKKVKAILSGRQQWQVTTTVEETILVDLFGDGQEDWVVIGSSFYKYTGKGYFAKVSEDDVALEIAQALRKCFNVTKKGIQKTYATKQKLISCLEFCRSALKISQKTSHFRCFKNITLNLETLEILPHSREHFLTSSIDFDYLPDDNSDCPPIFKAFIEKSYGIEKLDLIRIALRMYIDPLICWQKFFLLIGEQGSGKGVLAEVILNLFPKTQRVNLEKFPDLNSPQRCHQHLAGISLLTFLDLDGFQDRSGLINSLVVNEPLAFQPLYSNVGSNEARNIRLLICSTKHIEVKDLHSGLLRRMIPVTTKGKIADKDKDYLLSNKLYEEMPQIISWCMSLERDYVNHSIKNADNFAGVSEAKQEAKIQGDSVIDFLDYAIEPRHNSTISIVELYIGYVEHCKLFGKKAFSQKEFSRRVEQELKEFFVSGGKVEWDKNQKKTVKQRDMLVNVCWNIAFSIQGSTCTIDPSCCAPGGLEFLKNYDFEAIKQSLEKQFDDSSDFEILDSTDIVEIANYILVEKRFQNPEFISRQLSALSESNYNGLLNYLNGRCKEWWTKKHEDYLHKCKLGKSLDSF
jgi:phage/plasmid-associated DNA primase